MMTRDTWLLIEHLVLRELQFQEQILKTDERMIWFYLDIGQESAMHNKVDHRVSGRADCRRLRGHLAAVRAAMNADPRR